MDLIEEIFRSSPLKTLSADHTYISTHIRTLYAVITSPSTLFTVGGFHSLLLLSFFFWLSSFVVSFLTRVYRRLIHGKPVYLSAFTTFDAPKDWTVTTEGFLQALRRYNYTDESEQFVMKMLARSGLGENTSFPPSVMSENPDISLDATKKEAEFVIFGVLDQLFQKASIKPQDIDILIVNCSLYVPTPSLTAMIVNKYKMRSDIQSYNLGGMGCSAGLISVRLASDLLQVYRGARCVIVSTEAITPNIYLGNRKEMLVQNALFRVGGAALLLTNYHWNPPSSPSSPSSSSSIWPRYELESCIRCHLGQDDSAYTCVEQVTDEQGYRGVKLSKDLMNVAGKALRKNLTMLGPKVLPWSEQLKFALNMLHRKLYSLVHRKKNKSIPVQNVETTGETSTSTSPGEIKDSSHDKGKRMKEGPSEYVPKWDKAVQHWCIHAGGRGVIDAIQKGLNLSDEAVMPSRSTLERYGNTSSSSIWYELGWIEKNRLLQKGDRIIQIAFGSGFKCNSAVWTRVH